MNRHKIKHWLIVSPVIVYDTSIAGGLWKYHNLLIVLCHQLGYNPISTEGCMKLLEAIDRPSSSVRYLNLAVSALGFTHTCISSKGSFPQGSLILLPFTFSCCLALPFSWRGVVFSAIASQKASDCSPRDGLTIKNEQTNKQKTTNIQKQQQKNNNIQTNKTTPPPCCGVWCSGEFFTLFVPLRNVSANDMWVIRILERLPVVKNESMAGQRGCRHGAPSATREPGLVKIVVLPHTLLASLSGTFLQTLPELVTPLKKALVISSQLSTDTVRALRKVRVPVTWIRPWNQHSVQACTSAPRKQRFPSLFKRFWFYLWWRRQHGQLWKKRLI